MGNFNEWLGRRDESFWSTLGNAIFPGPDPEEVAEKEAIKRKYKKLVAMRQWLKAGKQGPAPFNSSDPDWQYISYYLKHPDGEDDNDAQYRGDAGYW